MVVQIQTHRYTDIDSIHTDIYAHRQIHTDIDTHTHPFHILFGIHL